MIMKRVEGPPKGNGWSVCVLNTGQAYYNVAVRVSISNNWEPCLWWVHNFTHPCTTPARTPDIALSRIV